MKKICDVCKGNGFVKVPYELAYEEQWADCEFCDNQGEIEVEEKTNDRGSGTSGSHTSN